MPTRPIDVVCTLFDGIRPAVVDVHEGTWRRFIETTLPALVARKVPPPRDDSEQAWQAAKRRLPGFVLAPVDGTRCDEHTGAHTALAIDVDALPDGDLGALQKQCACFRCAVYETASSTAEAPRVRVIAALAEPIDAPNVQAARIALAEALGLDAAAAGVTGAIPASQVMFAGRIRGTRARGLWIYAGELWQPPRVAKERTRRPLGSPKRADTPARARRGGGGAFDFHSPPDLSAIAAVIPYGVPCDRHLLARGLGGWLARRGYAPAAISEAVGELIRASGDSDPAGRAAEAQAAADRVCAGLEAPGWEALERWTEAHGDSKTLKRLERACRDPREPSDFGGDGACGVWSEWWAGALPPRPRRGGLGAPTARSRARRHRATFERRHWLAVDLAT